jgi:assimilatory nitrate reductase catalytic subunit
LSDKIITNNQQAAADKLSTTSEWTKTTCPYCGVGCGVEVKSVEVDTISNTLVDDNLVEGNNKAEAKFIVRGDKTHPANLGRLCSKGLALAETITNKGKLLTPSINGQQTTWDKATDYVANGFLETIKKYGEDSVAFYVSGQLLTEDYYVANKLIKGFIGSANIDTNSRLCMSSSVAGHKRAFGSDTVPNCYEDFELAELVVLIGSNLAWCHPVLYQRLKAAKEVNPQLKVVVIDPRKTDTCDIADLHLAIRSGSDAALFNGLLSYLANFNYLDHEYINKHTNDFKNALATAQEDTNTKYDERFNFLTLANITSLSITQLNTFYEWFAKTDKTLSVFSQGVNQSSSGTDKVNSIINCHLATGRIGREGSGPFSITGQPNAMGGREVGGLANMLAAHMDFPEKGNPESNAGWQTVSDFWKTKCLAKTPGLKAIDLFNAVDEGKIKAIWIMATNPVVSMPDSNHIKTALKKCPLVVVSDCIANTDTTTYGHVLLPAMGWAEKSGTVTNSERYISRQRSILPENIITTDASKNHINPNVSLNNSDDIANNREINQAKPDWWIIVNVAKKMGFKGFDFKTPADIFREHATLTGANNNGSRDLDISALANLTDEAYDNLTPVQWPLIPSVEKASTDLKQVKTTKRFFADGIFYTKNKKANMIAVKYKAPAHAANADYPIVLNSGRIRDQWHTMTRTGIATKLCAHLSEPFLQVHPQDAEILALRDGCIAKIKSKWGQAKARIVITNNVNVGESFMPIHWSQTHASDGQICSLISPDVDPVSGQPELKNTPINIELWEHQTNAITISKTELNKKLLDNYFEYWVKREIESGYLYYLASKQRSEVIITELQENLLSVLGINIEFHNKKEGVYRSAKILDKHLLAACIVAPNISNDDYAWLDTLLAKELTTDIQCSLLSGIARASLLTGKQICACRQVGELTIEQTIKEFLGAQTTTTHLYNNKMQLNGDYSADKTLDNVKTSTGAGTGCGSCVAELKQIIDRNVPAKIDAAI